MSKDTFPIREKSFKDRDAKDMNRGDKSNAGRRDDSELVLDSAKRAEDKAGWKGKQVHARVSRTNLTGFNS